MRNAWTLMLLAICACSNGGGGTDAGGDAADTGTPPASCSSDTDCANIGDHCFFVIDGGCTLQNLKGVCLGYTAPASCTPNVACGCDGTTISTCAPDGYVNRSSRNAGACPADAGSDTGSADASPE